MVHWIAGHAHSTLDVNTSGRWEEPMFCWCRCFAEPRTDLARKTPDHEFTDGGGKLLLRSFVRFPLRASGSRPPDKPLVQTGVLVVLVDELRDHNNNTIADHHCTNQLIMHSTIRCIKLRWSQSGNPPETRIRLEVSFRFGRPQGGRKSENVL